MNLALLSFLLAILTFSQYMIMKPGELPPGLVANAAWLLCALIAFANSELWGIDIHFSTVIVIFFSCIVFSLGDSIGRRIKTNDIETKRIVESFKISGLIIASCVVLGVICFVGQLQYLRSVATLTGYFGSTFGIFKAARTILNTSLNTVEKASVYTYLGLIINAIGYNSLFVFFANKRAGIKNKHKKYLVVPIVQAVLMVASTSRGGLLQMICYVLAINFFISARSNRSQGRKIAKGRIVKYSIIGLISLTGVFYFAGKLTGKTIGSSLIDSISGYSGAAIVAFDRWRTLSYDVSNARLWGQDLFIGVYSLIYRFSNIISPINVNLKSIYWGAGYYTNIYTTLLPYFENFGFIGTYIWLFFYGMIVGAGYKKAIAGKSVFFTIVYASVFFMIPYMPIAERLFSVIITPTKAIEILLMYLAFYYIIKRDRIR